MKKTFWDKRIPTLLGLIFIIFGIGLTSFLVNRGVIFVGQAGPSQTPESIKITNVSDTSFTVTYTTEDNVFGSINYGVNPSLGQTALDDRDTLSKSVVPHKLHSISANNLEPQTTYYFSITSAENKYLNNDEAFSVKTGPAIESSPSAQKPVVGKVILPSGSAPQDAVVYLSSEGSQAISTVVRSDGTYLLPLNSLRKASLDDYFELSEDTKLKMVLWGDNLTSNVIVSVKQTNPVPTITLSNNYDFYSRGDIASESASIATSSSFPEFEEDSSQIFNPTIERPSENEAFSDSQPNFEGKALPNETVEITIESDPITATVTSDSAGNWQFRPNEPLPPGDHKITVKTRDASGILRTITQNFTVYAEGTQIADTSTTKATTSITPTPPPTSSPSVSPTPTPSPSPTPTPLTQVLPTPTPIILTGSPTPPTSSLLPTGDSKTLAIGVLGVGVIIIGGLIFIITKGQIPL